MRERVNGGGGEWERERVKEKGNDKWCGGEERGRMGQRNSCEGREGVEEGRKARGMKRQSGFGNLNFGFNKIARHGTGMIRIYDYLL